MLLQYRQTWVLALALIVAGCATMGGYQPTVDPYDDPHAARIPSDEAECRELALHASGGTAKQTAIGGASGGLGGGAYEGFSAEAKFKQAFQTCMRVRGHHVLD